MSKKRFRLKEDDEEFIIIWDNLTKKEIGFNSQVVDLLNKQDEFIKNLIVETTQLSVMLHKDEIVEKIKELEDEARYSKDLVHGDVWDRKTNIVYCDVDSLIEVLNKQEQIIQKQSKVNAQQEKEYQDLLAKYRKMAEELYCKDRKLEELGIPIECCDKDE